MEAHNEKNEPWLSVPQFGKWDQKGEMQNYSMDFSKVRAMRKVRKKDVPRASLGSEQELMSTTTKLQKPHPVLHPHHQNHSPAGKSVLYLKTKGRLLLFTLLPPEARRSILNHFTCCAKA